MSRQHDEQLDYHQQNAFNIIFTNVNKKKTFNWKHNVVYYKNIKEMTFKTYVQKAIHTYPSSDSDDGCCCE